MAANTGILTYGSGRVNTGNMYYSPTAIVPLTNQPLASIYCFLSKVTPWPTEDDPPAPEQSQKYIKNVYKNMFVAKHVITSDMSLVIERIDWESGTVYDYYRDDIDMFELDVNGTILKRFYIKNRFDQVFKCLWNNNGGESTIEPYFEPGTFNPNLIFQGADDYKWKYMYTITAGTKLKFMDSAWMPVPIGTRTPNPTQSFAGSGSIEVINVTNSGSGYDEANAIVTVTITGDGKFATGNVIINSGEVTDISVANTGSNYTYANVTISSTQGAGATAVAYTSPIGGHGFDPPTELGARHIMITATFDRTENGKIPTDIDYRQIGVLVNPLAYFGTQIKTANAEIYKVTTGLVVSPGFGSYIPDETVYQSPDGTIGSATYSATVLSFDGTTNIISVINTLGTANNNAVIYGQNSGTARTVLQQQTPDFIPFSGNLIYLENREPVQRNSDGAEQFKLVLGY